jgi:single-strand DNA-binding protein
MAIARFSLAIDRMPDKNGDRQTDYPNVVCFGRQAEFVEKYFTKGMRVAVVGSIRTGSYTNRDGQKVYTTEVAADRVEFADGKGDRQGESRGNYGGGFNQERRDYGGQGNYAQPAPAEAAPEGFERLTDDDIPF